MLNSLLVLISCDYWWNDSRYPEFQRWIVGGPGNGYFNGFDVTGCFGFSRGFAGPEATWIVGAC